MAQHHCHIHILARIKMQLVLLKQQEVYGVVMEVVTLWQVLRIMDLSDKVVTP